MVLNVSKTITGLNMMEKRAIGIDLSIRKTQSKSFNLDLLHIYTYYECKNSLV